jgi:hypothetical protein
MATIDSIDDAVVGGCLNVVTTRRLMRGPGTSCRQKAVVLGASVMMVTVRDGVSLQPQNFRHQDTASTCQCTVILRDCSGFGFVLFTAVEVFIIMWVQID